MRLSHIRTLLRLDQAGAIGMLDMAVLSIIRRWHEREHVPILKISRRLGVSRNTIRFLLAHRRANPPGAGDLHTASTG